MGLVYLAALIVGFGTIAAQLVLSSSGSDGAELHGGGDAGAAGHAAAAGGHAHGGGKDVELGGPLTLLLSSRFWTFALMAFGLVGALLHYLGLAAPTLVPIFAVGMGLASGWLASWTFRALARSAKATGVESSSRDAVGQVGRVLVPLGKDKRGKVRVQIHGQSVDWVATTDEAALEEGASVLVEDVRGTVAHVSRAPEGLGPNSRG